MSCLVEDALNLTCLREEPDLVFFDAETTVKSPSKFKADPFYPENYVVTSAYKHRRASGDKPVAHGNGDHVLTGLPVYLYSGINERRVVLVAHNAKFDAHYLRQSFVKNAGTHAWHTTIIGIHDTMVIHYLITGEANASLERVAEYWGCTIPKDTTFKAQWEAGVQTEDMDIDALSDYCADDVTILEEVYDKQMEYLETASDQLRMLVNMQARITLALQEIEWNGECVDLEDMRKLEAGLHYTIEELEDKADTLIRDILGDEPVDHGVNVTSNHTLSHLIAGTPDIKYKKRTLVGTYKNGKDKFKQVEFEALMTHSSMYVAAAKVYAQTPLNKQDCVAVDEKSIDKYRKHMHPKIEEYINLVLQIRTASKIQGTYIDPILDQLNRNDTDLVHPQYNQAVTATGRLSSSNPNGQNNPPIVKNTYTSRFERGHIFFGDYDQLEVCGLADLCEDPALIQDITRGVDIHSVIGERVFGETMTKEERRIVKSVVFGTLYGGGAKTLAEQSGVNISLVKDIIKQMYNEYPRINAWHNAMERRINDEATDGEEVWNGHILKETMWESKTGRRYFFKQQPPKYHWQTEPSFNPSQIKNYPVQGFATGDIVPFVLGLLIMSQSSCYCIGLNPDEVKLVNTIHDSIGFDVNFSNDCESNDSVRDIIKDVAEYKVLELLHELTGTKLKVPLTFSFEDA